MMKILQANGIRMTGLEMNERGHGAGAVRIPVVNDFLAVEKEARAAVDRKSTRLNSSHGYISYAVFCLKKKKKYTEKGPILRRTQMLLFAIQHTTSLGL